MQNNPDHIARAYDLFRLELYDRALDEVQAALSDNPLNAEAHICGAWIFRARRDYARAEEAARAALRSEPNNPSAQHVLAIALWSQGRLGEAEAAFKEALAHPHHDQALHFSNYARFLSACRRTPAALAHVEQALALRPAFAPAHEVRAGIVRDLGRPSEAEAAYREALRLDPRHPAAHVGLGTLLLNGGRFAEALPILREALRLAPGHPDARDQFAVALKARHPFYATMLRLTHLPRQRWWRPSGRLIVTLIFFGMIISGGIASAEPELAGFIGLIAVLLLLLLLGAGTAQLLWRQVVNPLFNTLLLLDPEHRAMISYDPADAVVLVCWGLILAGLVTLLLSIMLVGAGHFAQAALAFSAVAGAGALLAGGLRGGPGRHRRLTATGFGIVMASGLGLSAGLLLPVNQQEPLIPITILSGLVGLIIYLSGRGQPRIPRPRSPARPLKRAHLTLIAFIAFWPATGFFGAQGLSADAAAFAGMAASCTIVLLLLLLTRTSKRVDWPVLLLALLTIGLTILAAFADHS